MINTTDQENAKRNIIGEEGVERIRLSMLADSGANMMAINENIQAQLELPFIEKRKAVMVPQKGGRSVQEFEVVGPVMVKFANRTAVCNAFILDGNSEPLLDAIPMVEMDVLIHPLRQELIVNPEHPNYAV